jgi:uncharacterized protein YceH (UPF0502 family)
MSIKIAPRMARKSTVRDTSGNIIDMLDETDGGWIIRNRRVVNEEKYNRIIQVEKDKREAALAITKATSVPAAVAESRAASPGKLDSLDKRVTDMESKLDAILKAVQK